MSDHVYTDISDILARKGEGRRALRKLSMAEKIMRIESLRERLLPFRAIRENRVIVNQHAADGSHPLLKV